MSATKNEKKFKQLMIKKFGENCLNGKKRFFKEFDGYEKVEISVDESFNFGDKRSVLIEIDSGNMAKLIVGQYTLLDGISNCSKKNTLFLVIHYYKNYNPNRTIKNLNAVKNILRKESYLKFNAFHIDDFEKLVYTCKNLDELGNKIWNVNSSIE